MKSWRSSGQKQVLPSPWAANPQLRPELATANAEQVQLRRLVEPARLTTCIQGLGCLLNRLIPNFVLNDALHFEIPFRLRSLILASKNSGRLHQRETDLANEKGFRRR